MSFFLFPGQGSQRPGMGADFHAVSDAAREIFERTAAVMGAEFLDTLFHGDQETLNDTRVAQVGLLAVGVAIAKQVEAMGHTCVGCAGHSLGEIPALVVVGALDFEDALHVTRERARLMSENVPDGGMAAVIGLDAERIEAVLPEGVQIANYNGPGQTIVSGTLLALEAAQSALKDAGAKRVLPLKVSGPFHSRLMADAEEGMRKTLASVAIAAPAVRFVSSVSAQDEQEPERIRELLCRQLTCPVRWTEVMALIGPARALELGPGKVLEGLAKRMEGGPIVLAAGDFATLEALVA